MIHDAWNPDDIDPGKACCSSYGANRLLDDRKAEALPSNGQAVTKLESTLTEQNI